MVAVNMDIPTQVFTKSTQYVVFFPLKEMQPFEIPTSVAKYLSEVRHDE